MSAVASTESPELHPFSLERHFALPAGTLSVGRRVAGMLTAQIFEMVGFRPVLSDSAVLGRLLAAGLLHPASVQRPVAVGDGYVHVDLLPDDEDLFAAVLDVESHAGPAAVAAVAQEYRLAVTPYQPSALVEQRTLVDPVVPRKEDATSRRSTRPPVIVDMTTMWAGPLCTALLEQLGAVVVRIEPACRPDGLRGTPQLHRSLHRSDLVLDLDLRNAGDRALFDHLLRHADLLVESFSERVLPNLGYGPERLDALNRRLGHLAIRAFPTCSNRKSWVAYGGGVHAASGLGLVAGDPAPAAFAYLDPLTGLRAVAAALSMLSTTVGHQRATVSLAGSAALLRDDSMDVVTESGRDVETRVDDLELLGRSVSEPLWDGGFALW